MQMQGMNNTIAGNKTIDSSVFLKSRLSQQQSKADNESRFYHTGNLSTQNLSLQKKHSIVLEMLEMKMNEGIISQEQFESFKEEL